MSGETSPVARLASAVSRTMNSSRRPDELCVTVTASRTSLTGHY